MMASAGQRVSVDVIAAELARSKRQFEAVVGDADDPRRDKLRRVLDLDSYVFIPVYSVVFIASSVLLGRRYFSAALWLALGAGASGIGTALFDVAENVRTLRVLRGAPGEASTADVLVAKMRLASLAKWFLAFVTTGLLSASFLQRGSWWYVVAGVYLASATLGMVAVLLNLGRQSRPRAIQYAFYGMGFALALGLAFAVVLAFR